MATETVVRGRGRKAPENLRHIKNLAHARNGEQVKALPPAPETSWDSTALGIVGPVKDQSQCGSCWDFSGTCVAEVANYKAAVLKSDGSQALSEEYVLSCLRNGGCDGDDNTTVLAAAKANGLPLTSDYGPYSAGNGRPGACAYKPSMRMVKIDDWGFADGANGDGVTPVTEIKEAIKAYGCVGCSIAADDAFESFGEGTTPGSVFKGSGSTEIDHDIVLVGWDDSKQAWKLRNSWGTGWGEGGYIWISYGANLVGTEAVWATVASVVPPIPPVPPTPPAPVVPVVLPSYNVTMTGLIPGLFGSSQVTFTGVAVPQASSGHHHVSTIPWLTLAEVVAADVAAGASVQKIVQDVFAALFPPAVHKAVPWTLVWQIAEVAAIDLAEGKSAQAIVMDIMALFATPAPVPVPPVS